MLTFLAKPHLLQKRERSCRVRVGRGPSPASIRRIGRRANSQYRVIASRDVCYPMAGARFPIAYRGIDHAKIRSRFSTCLLDELSHDSVATVAAT
jgi:hypothetical protein